ncbi:MAG: site-specific integrase [Alistipes sp.]|uniref:site-specific integrase n=1 Tax=Alistipes sp. TaxID=1872444 RepID=UPI0025C39EF9|nr:site-specific integrase [Alistipes sp.]MCD8273382.1 site-specific integrase [Alistipes sp.]
MRSTFKVLFYLKRNKDKKQPVVPVMGRITVNGSISQFSAKLSVPESLWEVNGGRAKGRSVEAERINRHLDNIRTQIGKHYQSICDRDSFVTAEKVKNAYLGFGEKYRLLLESFEKFTSDLQKRVGIDRSYGTWKRYHKSIDHLRSFMHREYHVSDIPLAELEQSFIEQYHVYLKSILGLKPMTVSGYLKCLKYVVKIAFNNGWMPRNPFALYQYTAPNPVRNFLTEEELRRMMTTRLRYRRQDYNRDMFLFSCFTGICYADMASLTYDQLEQDTNGDWWLSGNRQKTETKYVVKLLPYPLFILDKYRGLAGNRYLFKLSSLDSIDDSLKNIARECGIDKQLSFHIARHTYATTICLSNGVSLEALSKMLGHKHITTTQIYAKVTQPMIDREINMLREKLGSKFSI